MNKSKKKSVFVNPGKYLTKHLCGKFIDTVRKLRIHPLRSILCTETISKRTYYSLCNETVPEIFELIKRPVVGELKWVLLGNARHISTALVDKVYLSPAVKLSSILLLLFPRYILERIYVPSYTFNLLTAVV